MNLRTGDDQERLEQYKALRKTRLSDSSIASMAGIVGLVFAIGGFAYSAFYVKFESDQNGRDIQSLQSWIINHQNRDEARENITEQRLERIEEKLDKLIGEIDGRKH